MRLVKDIKQNLGFLWTWYLRYTVPLFEDNPGAVELDKVPKMLPRTKHLNPKYHHFRKYVHKGLVKVVQVSTKDQWADIFTKNLPRDLLLHFRKKILGW
jgi:hypothetical protein